jgi:hypothetical protein
MNARKHAGILAVHTEMDFYDLSSTLRFPPHRPLGKLFRGRVLVASLTFFKEIREFLISQQALEPWKVLTLFPGFRR